MKVRIKNLGVLKQAAFTLGDLTILCGGNNAGKTYATYALYGFLSFWQERFVVRVKEDEIGRLMAEGVLHIDLARYVEDAHRIRVGLMLGGEIASTVADLTL